jgi:hypothetical protein
MTIQELTKAIEDMTEAMAHLTTGDDGLLDVGTTQEDVTDLMVALKGLVEECEDGLGTRLTRAAEFQIEDTVAGWYEQIERACSARG